MVFATMDEKSSLRIEGHRVNRVTSTWNPLRHPEQSEGSPPERTVLNMKIPNPV